MESSKQTEARAAAWLLKRDSKDWSDEDEARLAEWFDAATVNRVAFLRLEAGWEEASRLKALGAGFARDKVPTVDELAQRVAPMSGGKPASPRSRARVPVGGKMAAIAAGIVVLAGIGIFVYATGPMSGERYATPVGGMASVPLKDGSNVTLNTASRIRVQMTQEERHIELTQGEAFFDVARDRVRPFVVQAGRKRIVAVGTRFSVRREGTDVRVVVTEGAVRVDNPGAEASLLTAGAVASATDARVSVQTKSVPEAEDTLSWRSGYIVFQETALAEAVAEFNRYSERPIVIHDAEVGAIRLTGKFRSTNRETFVRLLEDTFPIRVEHTPERIVLSAR